jgi:hypothetical protein
MTRIGTPEEIVQAYDLHHDVAQIIEVGWRCYEHFLSGSPSFNRVTEEALWLHAVLLHAVTAT